jgi:membrane carboxypeptidase/penicillin-binding protein
MVDWATSRNSSEAVAEQDMAFYRCRAEVSAPYHEMVRVRANYLGRTLTGGYGSHDADAKLQEAANLAVAQGLGVRDRRHGYWGPEAR